MLPWGGACEEKKKYPIFFDFLKNLSLNNPVVARSTRAPVWWATIFSFFRWKMLCVLLSIIFRRRRQFTGIFLARYVCEPHGDTDNRRREKPNVRTRAQKWRHEFGQQHAINAWKRKITWTLSRIHLVRRVRLDFRMISVWFFVGKSALNFLRLEFFRQFTQSWVQ